MEPVMNDVNDVDARKGKGNIVIGAMLVLTGLTIMLDRAGVWHLSDQWTLWPIILGGIGLARFLQSVPGEPKQGLLFLTAAVWLFLGDVGGGTLRTRPAHRGILLSSKGCDGLTIRCHHSPCSASGSQLSSDCRCPACDRSATTTSVIACVSCR
jgi:hypothetical protein